MTVTGTSAIRADRRWAVIVDSDPQMLSYLGRSLMFFQPSYRVASAAGVEHLAEWMDVQAYEIGVLGCLGSAKRDGEAAALLRLIPALVTLSCAHRDSGIARPPRLSVLLAEVRAASGRTDIEIDLTAMNEVIV